MLNKIIKAIKFINSVRKDLSLSRQYTPVYRIINIRKTNEDHYEVTVQIINESNVFIMQPQEILSDDKFVDLFSPRDIRTLTYLGYLEINSPKYKILAKRLSEDQDKIFFAIKERGNKNILIKTAKEVNQEKEILHNLESADAHVIGYTAATESMLEEKKEIRKIISQKNE